MGDFNVAGMVRGMGMSLKKVRTSCGEINILYITYDGLLDPLGSSQILPYIFGLSSHKKKFHILSFEKRKRFRSGGKALKNELKSKGIEWTPLRFSENKSLLSKLIDLSKMYICASWISFSRRIKIVHARGHAPAEVAMLLKRIKGSYFIFDFRGLWVDERVDKGGWDLRRRTHLLQYKLYKNKEYKLLSSCDELIVLTNAVIKEVIKYGLPKHSNK